MNLPRKRIVKEAVVWFDPEDPSIFINDGKDEYWIEPKKLTIRQNLVRKSA